MVAVFARTILEENSGLFGKSEETLKQVIPKSATYYRDIGPVSIEVVMSAVYCGRLH
jgi:hypothetical protein